jgi:2-polyprenyl-6-methoxyphenol hydroxylase-like FAD-dependent oxidoreductase
VYDVVVVGAGPVGLMLAGELAEAGRRPVVLEALPEPSRAPKANGLVGDIVRVLDERGLYGQLAGQPDAHPRPVSRFMYGGFALDLRGLPDNPLHVLAVPQRRLEEVLASRATRLGVEVRRGHAVSGLTQDVDGVTVAIDGPDGPYRLRAAHVVGCDGAHSRVRKAAGIGFPGTTKDDAVTRSAHVRLPRRALTPITGRLRGPGGPYRPFLVHRTPRGVLSFARFHSGPFLVTTTEWSSDAVGEAVPVSVDELRASLGRVLGRDVALAAPDGPGPFVLRRSASRHTRVAERYRVGRVFLAGDAAHVIAAFGGAGLNLGLADAVDLAARLARGDPAGYEDARRPSAESVVAQAEEQAALLAPGPEVDARRARFAVALTDPTFRLRLAAAIAGR